MIRMRTIKESAILLKDGNKYLISLDKLEEWLRGEVN